MTNASLLERLESVQRCTQRGHYPEAHGVLAHLIRDVRANSCDTIQVNCPCRQWLDNLPPGTVVNVNIQTPGE